MNRHKVWLIIRREYLESVRKKSFLFGLIATPAIFAAAMFLPLLAGDLFNEEDISLGVIDATGTYGAQLRDSFREEAEGGQRSHVREDESDAAGEADSRERDGNRERRRGLPAGAFRPTLEVWSPETAPSAAALAEAVRDGSLAGWLEIPADFEESGATEFHAESVLDITALQNLRNRLEGLLSERRAADLGLSADQRDALLQPVDLRVFRLGDGDETNPEELYLRAVLLVMMLFFALLPTSQILMRSVIEEKSNRVVEVLLSSVTPREIMVGKIIGLGAVGLTMIGAWAGAGALLSAQAGRAFPVEPGEAAVFLLYFFPGYFLYAALLGAIGSICSTERDAQPFLTPISLLLVLPVLLGVAIAQNPDHAVARALSFVPFLTPSLMMFRYTIQPLPLSEIIATWTTLVAGTVAMFWVASRVFRTGILMTGKRPTLPEVARWIGAGS